MVSTRRPRGAAYEFLFSLHTLHVVEKLKTSAGGTRREQPTRFFFLHTLHAVEKLKTSAGGTRRSLVLYFSEKEEDQMVQGVW